jgi:hypothetical protein
VSSGPEQPARPETVTGGGVGGSSGNGWPGAGTPTYRPGAQMPGPPVAPRPQPTGAPAPQQPVTQAVQRPGGTPPRPAEPTRPVSVGRTGRRGGRRARLTVKRIDPWSTLKFSFVYSLAGLVVLLVAVIALYAIVDAMGVIDSIRTFLHDVEGNKSGGGIAAWLGFGRVMTVALVIGSVNVILFTAFATLTAFVYNVCTDLVGGIEVTLTDRS